MKTVNLYLILLHTFWFRCVSSNRILSKSLSWSWHHDNGTDHNRTSNSCNAQKDCDTCSSTFGCHWCSFDEACHAKGSIYGCSFGETCPQQNHNQTDHSCASHKSCTDCALSSSLCHWCAFDEQCHAIGSVHGCIRGVDCYSNDRCQRLQPEPIEEGVFQDIGFVPLFLIFTVGLAVICCSSVLYSSAFALKSVYEDWVQEREEFYTVVGDGRSIMMGMSLNVPSSGSVVTTPGPRPIRPHDNNSPTSQALAFQTPPFQSPPPHAFQRGNLHVLTEEQEEVEENELGEGENHDKCVELGGNRNDDALEYRQTSNTQEAENNNLDIHKPMEGDPYDFDPIDAENSVTEPLLPQIGAASVHTRLPFFESSLSNYSPVNCLFKSCRIWYMFTMFASIILVGCSIVFFPKAPEYNVCSDEFAWKSIIDSFTHLNMEASFEVLMSVKNRNRLDVTLDSFGGSFSHQGENVGTWTLRKSVIQASSITDVMLTCTVAPDRWEALGLISDFYRGKLMVSVNMQGYVRVPGIFYSIPVKMTDVLVKVNDPDNKDRHLCACPEWKDLSPTVAPILPFQAAIVDPVHFTTILK